MIHLLSFRVRYLDVIHKLNHVNLVDSHVGAGWLAAVRLVDRLGGLGVGAHICNLQIAVANHAGRPCLPHAAG